MNTRSLRRAVTVFLAVVALAGLVGCGSQPTGTANQEVRVAAAADLKFALEDVVQAFRAKHPGVTVSVTYGSSGTLYAQLTNQAPFDLFLSADMHFPRQLAEQGRVVPGSEFLYAVGHLVLWVRNDSKLDVQKLGIRTVIDPSVKKVAIANPKTAPYGRAAEAALKHLGVYDEIRDRLVFGDNIAQTAQFVESGAADVGLIALSLALAPTLRDKGRYWPVPVDAYPKLEQGGAIVAGARNADGAGALRAFLTSAEGRALLNRFGFTGAGE